ncbi:hypothetical protein K8R43_02380 [archaeon]|nr:hypothetical protein [archaeon]
MFQYSQNWTIYNEVLCKALDHNIVILIHEMFELGININFQETTNKIQGAR